MKKIIQAGLLVSGLAGSLIAAQTTDEITTSSVNVSRDGVISLKFTSPFANPLITVSPLTENVKDRFTINLQGADQDIYKILLQRKRNVPNCKTKIFRPLEALQLEVSSSEIGSTESAVKIIKFDPCFNATGSPTKPDVFKNEQTFVETGAPGKKFFDELCPKGKNCTSSATALIKALTKEDEFVIIRQNGKVLGKFSGDIRGKEVKINAFLPTTVIFDSIDGQVARGSEVTVKLFN